MKNIQQFKYDPKFVVNSAISSERDFCMGYMNPGALGNGYITTIKLSTGLVDISQPWSSEIEFDKGTAGIVSYDRCECNDAYIGSINMLTASSFSGQMGAIWGYDLAKADDLYHAKLYDQPWPDGTTTPVYSILPLMDAAERLFGRNEQRRFNPLPGSMVICANKSATNDPGLVTKGYAWSFIALSILMDRSQGSNLFIEDCGIIDNSDGSVTLKDVKKLIQDTIHKVTNCTVVCGVDQNIKYREIFAGFKITEFDSGQVGCALACGPYVTLAQNSIPAGCNPSDLTDMSISEWETALALPPLQPTDELKSGFLGKDIVVDSTESIFSQ
jgi:histidine decarboxylase